MNIGQRPSQLTIDIQEKHIKAGIAKDSTRCPIAEAIREQYPHYRRISVDIATIRVSDPKRGLRMLYFTPPPCQKIIINTDQGNRKGLKPVKVRATAGQVVPIHRRTEKEKAQMRKTWKKKYAPKKLVKTHGGPGRVPIVSGGKLPPIASGSKRTFGLRAMQI